MAEGDLIRLRAKQERIVPRIAAPHVVEFRDVAIGGQTYTCWNGSVAVLGANRIFGGGSGYYYLGNYDQGQPI
jgi:hypothetical protein